MTDAPEQPRPHPTSMAVWGAPSPVPMQSTFQVKVGVKCAEGCALAGRLVRVTDEAGSTIGEAPLGEKPWKGTQGLYVAELSLQAPAAENVFNWSTSFAGDDSETPHDGASTTFSFRTAGPPEHTVVVKVVDRDEGKPLGGITVLMGLYRAVTDAHGHATFAVPKSTYELKLRNREAEAPSTTVEVDQSCSVEILARPAPQSGPDETEIWM